MRLTLLLFAVMALAQSQPPPPTPRKDTKGEQTNSTTQQRQVRTDNSQSSPNPITVNQYASQSDNGNKRASESEQYASAFRDSVNMVSTALLAACTFLLFIATGALCVVAYRQWRTMEEHKASFEAIATNMSSGLAETTKAANAAKRSADMLVNTERAWLRVVDIKLTTISASAPGANQFIFDLENKGRTAARLTGPYRFKFASLAGLEQLPGLPDYGPAAGLIPDDGSPIYGRLLAPGELNGPIPQACLDPEITEEVANEINHNIRRLYFYAFVKYFDCADQERELQFCYTFIPGDPNTRYPGSWVLAGPKEYNKHT